MWIVAIAWMYVAVMMTMAEATAPNGTLLGAMITFIFYGVLPAALVMYLISTPARRRARQAKEAAEWARQQTPSQENAKLSEESAQPNTGGLTPGDVVSAEREKN